jgi:glycine/D-amino acid oxidase-like deaminating enzyme
VNAARPWTIVGQGLAGTCLAWQLWRRGVEFVIVDREQGGSSRVAAGLINPVTGKNFEPSGRIDVFLPEALGFYQEMEALLGSSFWHPLPVIRLASDESEWKKMLEKSKRPDVAAWLAHDGKPIAADGWTGALELHGGGRLDTRAFLDASRAFFAQSGIYRHEDITSDAIEENTILCDGAAGLLAGRCGEHRCAKGEILTLEAKGWDESAIRVGGGGWLVPLGGGCFKAGATYEWNQLDEAPTDEGRHKVEAIIRRLGGTDFTVIAHEAGVRPILRRSEPLVGPLPSGAWMFNGLGSKGSLYAPGMARRLPAWMLDGETVDPSMDIRVFLTNSPKTGRDRSPQRSGE